MANSRIYLKSEAGGTTTLSRDTTANSGNLVLPASGNVASVDTAVTDNAIARYDGTTGKLQNSGVIIDDNGNIGSSGNVVLASGSKIQGDFSSTTDTSRTSLQTSTANSFTVVNAIPNGTGPLSSFRAFNNQDASNSSFAEIYCDQSQSMYRAGKSGTGTYLPMTFVTNGAERMRIDTAGNVGIGKTPVYKLDVNGNIGYGVNGVGYIISDTNWGCLIKADSAGAVAQFAILDNAGNKLIAVDSNGYFLQYKSTGIGYGTGAGGTVTQLTSKSTAVTLNKPSGTIIMNNASLAAGASIQFIVYNSLVSNNDTIVINQNNFYLNTTYYRFEANASSNGAFGVRVTNITGTSLSDVIPINFTIIKGANS